MSPLLLYGLVVAGDFLGALASYFFKGAAMTLSGVLSLLKSKGIWIGGVIYLVAFANNVFLMKYLDYSVVYALASITYIFTMILANRLLKEPISRRKMAGVACIVAGAALLAFSG
ncbi:MAG: multidrug transporter [Clostridiales Family XIII bacterium]|jgi:drug/metabolite transporter (DMT)-like permease|nr:multidrug transporter [Clostridiales Family XIII bacterium]